MHYQYLREFYDKEKLTTKKKIIIPSTAGKTMKTIHTRIMNPAKYLRWIFLSKNSQRLRPKKATSQSLFLRIIIFLSYF